MPSGPPSSAALLSFLNPAAEHPYCCCTLVLLLSQTLSEFIEDTEDHVNTALDAQRNRLISCDICFVGLNTASMVGTQTRQKVLCMAFLHLALRMAHSCAAPHRTATAFAPGFHNPAFHNPANPAALCPTCHDSC